MTWMPLVTLIRNLIADGEWHRFEEIADAIVGPADDLHMIPVPNAAPWRD
jgi:hypothetical protein